MDSKNQNWGTLLTDIPKNIVENKTASTPDVAGVLSFLKKQSAGDLFKSLNIQKIPMLMEKYGITQSDIAALFDLLMKLKEVRDPPIAMAVIAGSIHENPGLVKAARNVLQGPVLEKISQLLLMR